MSARTSKSGCMVWVPRNSLTGEGGYMTWVKPTRSGPEGRLSRGQPLTQQRVQP